MQSECRALGVLAGQPLALPCKLAQQQEGRGGEEALGVQPQRTAAAQSRCMVQAASTPLLSALHPQGQVLCWGLPLDSLPLAARPCYETPREWGDFGTWGWSLCACPHCGE